MGCFACFACDLPFVLLGVFVFVLWWRQKGFLTAAAIAVPSIALGKGLAYLILRLA